MFHPLTCRNKVHDIWDVVGYDWLYGNVLIVHNGCITSCYISDSLIPPVRHSENLATVFALDRALEERVKEVWATIRKSKVHV